MENHLNLPYDIDFCYSSHLTHPRTFEEYQEGEKIYIDHLWSCSLITLMQRGLLEIFYAS